MHWSSFIGGLVGAAVGTVALFGLVLAVDWWERRQQEARKQHYTLEHIQERHLEEYIVNHFPSLFPGWQIVDDPASSLENAAEHRPAGIHYRTPAGEVDILCTDRKGALVVIELKRNRAPHAVVSQVSKYIAWVRHNLARPGQRVKGLVIAGSFDTHLSCAVAGRRDVQIWTYAWQLKLNRHPAPDLRGMPPTRSANRLLRRALPSLHPLASPDSTDTSLDMRSAAPQGD